MFYGVTLLAWHWIGLYYKSLLWFVALKIGYVVSALPLGSPELNLQNKLCCSIGGLTFFPNMEWYTVCVLYAVPLLLSTSGVPFWERIRMVLTGAAVLFPFQVLCVFLGMYAWLYGNYPGWLSAGRVIGDEILVYGRTSAEIADGLNHFAKVFMRRVLSVGAWIALVMIHKRRSDQDLFSKLL